MSTDNGDDQALIEAHARFVALDEDGMIDAADEFQESAYALGLARGRLAAERQVRELREQLAVAEKDAARFRFVVDCPIRTLVAINRLANDPGFDLTAECDRFMVRTTSTEGKDHG